MENNLKIENKELSVPDTQKRDPIKYFVLHETNKSSTYQKPGSFHSTIIAIDFRYQ